VLRSVASLSSAHIRAKPVRFLLTSVGVGLGVALYSSIAIINYSTRDSFRTNIESIAGKASLTVSGSSTGFSEEYVEKIKKIPGIKAAIPMVEARAYMSGNEGESDTIQILGVDLLQESAVRNYKTTDTQIIEDPLVFLNNPDSIILTKELAKRRGIKIDDSLQLATTLGTKKFIVRGLLEPEGAAKAYGGTLAIMDIDGARFSFGKEGKVDRIDLVTEEGADNGKIREEVVRLVPDTLSVLSPELKAQNTDKMIRAYQTMLVFFSSLALLVGIFIVLNSVSISVVERKQEIGILRALGGTKVFILNLFLAEAVFTGLVGGGLGIGLGRALADVLVKQVTTSLTAQFQTHVSLTHLQYPLQEYAWIVGLSVITCVLGSLFPAWLGARTSPVQAIRSDDGMTSLHRDNRSVFGQLGFVLLCISLISMRVHFTWLGSFVTYVTQACAVVGSALLVPYLVLFVLNRTRGFVLKRGGLLPHLAKEQLVAQPGRTSSNLMALSVGLFMVILIATVKTSFRVTLLDWIGDALSSDIVVSSAGRVITADLQTIDENIAREVLEVPGVVSELGGGGIASRILPVESEGFRGKYMIKANDAPGVFVSQRSRIIEGADKEDTLMKLYESDEPRVIVSTNYFIEHPDVGIGDKILIPTPLGKIAFKVVGKCRDYASPVGVFYLNREIYKKYFNDRLVSAFAVHVKQGFNHEEVRLSIERKLGKKYHLSAISQAAMKKEMGGAVDQSFAYTRAVEISALLVSMLGLLNTLLVSVLERMRLFAVMRAVGASSGQIFKIILYEALIQGVLGAILASSLGLLVGVTWVKYALGYTLGWEILVHIPWSGLLVTMAAGIVVSCLAGLYPAYRAANLSVVSGLGRAG